MKRITTILLFILFCNPKSFGQTQTVSINSLIVDNVSVNSNVPVNIHPSAITTISFGTEVKFTSPQDNGGTINIYYQKSKTSPIITANGGNGGNLLFNGGTSATRTFIITLEPAQFDASGGYFYSEYKTSKDVVYKSTNITIVKTIPDTNPIPPSDPNYASQMVPYGGTPLLPDFPNYFDISAQDWISSSSPYNVVLRYKNPWALYESKTIKQRTFLKNGTVLTEPQNMSITVSAFLQNYIGLTINNRINNDQYLFMGQNPQTIIGNQASETHSTGNRTNATNPLTNYQWQKRIIYPLWWGNFSYGLALYGWKDIPGATQQNYTPSAPTRGMEYRRLVLEKTYDDSPYRNCATSNVITIYPIDNTSTANIICCNHTVYNNTIPNPIVGSIIPGSIVYKWQSSLDGINWNDVSIGKDFTHERPTGSGGRQPYVGTIKYRRLALDYSTNLYTLSNESTVIYSSLSTKNNNKKEQVGMDSNLIIIYPNPSTSIITVDGIDNITSYETKVIDSTGKTVLTKKANQSSNESLQVDISTLTNGIYILELQNEANKFTKKIIKN